jgi:hypothetical protein
MRVDNYEYTRIGVDCFELQELKIIVFVRNYIIFVCQPRYVLYTHGIKGQN